MLANEAIKNFTETSEFLCTMYLQDLTDAEMMVRVLPEMNHINWQVGHLITSEHKLIESIRPGSMPPLPEGFAERYTKDKASSDDSSAFSSKAELMEIASAQRRATLAALEKETPEAFDAATGLDYAPTVAAMYLTQGTHWLMHSGQWVAVRRKLGRPPLF